MLKQFIFFAAISFVFVSQGRAEEPDIIAQLMQAGYEKAKADPDYLFIEPHRVSERRKIVVPGIFRSNYTESQVKTKLNWWWGFGQDKVKGWRLEVSQLCEKDFQHGKLKELVNQVKYGPGLKLLNLTPQDSSNLDWIFASASAADAQTIKIREKQNTGLQITHLRLF